MSDKNKVIKILDSMREIIKDIKRKTKMTLPNFIDVN